MYTNENALFRSLSISERNQNVDKSKIFQSENRLEKYWRSQSPFVTHPALLDMRLESEGLSHDLFNYLTSENEAQLAGRFKEVPEWMSALKQGLPFEHPSSLPKVTNSAIRTKAFLSVIEPLLKEGYVTLKECVLDIVLKHNCKFIEVNAICEILYQELAARCAMICARALVLELHIAREQNTLIGDTPKARYQYFIETLNKTSVREQILSDYPVMTRLVMTTIAFWKSNSLELITNLIADAPVLAEHFFSSLTMPLLVDVETAVGDSHNKGKTVAVFSFSGDKKLVYKPRSIGIEASYSKLLDWVNSKTKSLLLKSLKTLECSDHGWVEFAEHKTITTEDGVKRFYRRQGALLGLMYTLEANDFHYENIIANGEYPVLVDLETLFHPWINELGNESDVQAPATALKRTVLSTGLLPRRIWTQQGQNAGIDLSGFSEVQDQLTPIPVLEIENAGTDEMIFVRKKVSFTGASNMPTLKGKSVRAVDYSAEISEGFQLLYTTLLQNKHELICESGPLDFFKGVETRIIFRETRTYASFLNESLHPDFLGDALERDIFYDQLWIAAKHKPYLVDLISFEQKALRQLDIPIFHTKADSKNLIAEGEYIFNNFFKMSGLERVKNKIANLNQEDLKRQKWVIRSALLSADLSNRKATHSPIKKADVLDSKCDSQLIEAVEKIAQTIASLAFRSNGGASWFTWKAIGSTHWDLEAMDATFYDGLSGMICFLAYAGEVLNNEKYRQLAQEALVTARYLWRFHPNDIGSLGLFSGWGGIVYTLCHLATLWRDTSLLDEAFSLVPHIESHVDKDTNQDIVGGCAGAIIALLTLNELMANERIVEVAKQCGLKLVSLSHKQSDGIGWILESAGDKALAGMSHGVAGISYALIKLYKACGDPLFMRTAEDALSYERSLYSDKSKNWPDLREGSRPESSSHCNGHYYMTAWCHGAPGIALTRLQMEKLIKDPHFEDEICAAISTTMKNGFLDNHCLCHGSLGNLDVLLEANRVLPSEGYYEQARHLALQIVQGQKETGWLSGYMFNLETPGFMVGLAGMGYQLLRVAYPEKVPSILSLGAPVKLENSSS